MQENDVRAAVQAMRVRLIEQRDLIERQIQACDTMLAALPEGTAAASPVACSSPALAAEVAAGLSSVPAPAGPAAAVPASTAPPAPPLPPEARQALLVKASSRARGALEARVELAVADCGETFSFHDVLARYQATFGEGGYKLSESVGSALWKLARKRNYRIVQSGTGTLPTIYGK